MEPLGYSFVDPLEVLLEPWGVVKLQKFSWTSKMAKMMDPILPIVSILRYWAIILGSFGGPGSGFYHNAEALFHEPAV